MEISYKKCSTNYKYNSTKISLSRSFLFSCVICFIAGCKCNESITFPTHIVFTSGQAGTGLPQIYIMNPDGSGQKRFTNDIYRNDQSSISALGLKVTFRSDRTGKPQIWCMNGDGTGLVQLTNFAGGTNGGRWGSNGRLVFSALDGAFNGPNIYSMRSDGTDLKQLTVNPNRTGDIEPCYSPDGKKVVFSSNRIEILNVFIMNADGSNQIPLTNNSSNNGEPSFSPDGTKIAFWSKRDGNNEIYIMNADGTGQTNISNNAANDHDPIFSPDTNEIAFVSNRDGNDEIYIMNADGTNIRRLTTNTVHDWEPDWR